MRWRTKIVLNFNLVAKRGRIRIMHQHPRTAGRQKVRQQRQLRLGRLRFCRTRVEIVRHGDDGEQDADHTQQGQQSKTRPARAGTRETRP